MSTQSTQSTQSSIPAAYKRRCKLCQVTSHQLSCSLRLRASTDHFTGELCTTVFVSLLLSDPLPCLPVQNLQHLTIAFPVQIDPLSSGSTVTMPSNDLVRRPLLSHPAPVTSCTHTSPQLIPRLIPPHAAFSHFLPPLQVIDLTSLLAEVHAEIQPGEEYFRPTARQYTALNYKGVCYSIISAVDSRSTMDATFDMAAASEAAFQASHNGDQKATGGLSCTMPGPAACVVFLASRHVLLFHRCSICRNQAHKSCTFPILPCPFSLYYSFTTCGLGTMPVPVLFYFMLCLCSCYSHSHQDMTHCGCRRMPVDH